MDQKERYCEYCMEPIGIEENVCGVCHQDQRIGIASPQHHLKPGTLLNNGRYLVGRALGQGGFGITYIGRDLTLRIRVAIKEYYPSEYVRRGLESELYSTMEAVKAGFNFQKGVYKFLEEARTMAMFSEKTEIVNVRDFFSENGTAYIVMEYLDGMTLKEYFGLFDRLPVKTILGLFDPLLKVLHEMHGQNVIHRDISPDNIMLLKSGRLKLLDFGAAVELVGTKSMSVVLKPGYAPLEQYGNKAKQWWWTDVYAACATMYMCITGVRPDYAPDRVFEDDLASPSSLGISITPRQEKALLHGLAVSWQNRTQSIAELRRELGLEEGIQSVALPWPVKTGTENKLEGGKIEHYLDGTTIEENPDGSVTIRYANGEMIDYSPEHRKTIYDPFGGKTICDSNGMLEEYLPPAEPQPPQKIVKAPVQAPGIPYDGKPHVYGVASTEDYTVNTPAKTDAGVYDVTICLKDKANSAWEDGSTDDLLHRFVIERKPVAAPVQAEPIVYNGKPHTYPVKPSQYYTVEAASKIDAGIYRIIISLKDKVNTCWKDGSTDDIIHQFVIRRMLVPAPAQAAPIVYNGKSHTYPVKSSQYYTVEAVSKIDAGIYRVIISLKDKVNTCWEGGSTDDIIHQFVIRRMLVSAPAQAASIPYDGKPHIYPVKPSDFYVVEPVVGIFVGSYAVTIALKDKTNTAWEDGSTGDLTHQLKIGPEQPETPSKDKRRILLVASAAAAIIICLVLGGFFSKKVSLYRMKERIPVERAMASDCAEVLRSGQITGGILDVTVDEDTLREETKAYVAQCSVTVLEEDGNQRVYHLELWYQYMDNQWTLHEGQSQIIE